MDYSNRNNSSRDNKQKTESATGSVKKASRVSVDEFVRIHPFDPQWIKKGADANMVQFANDFGKYMAPTDRYDKQKLSTSQIRNVFGEIKRIQMKGITTGEGKTSFFLLKPKVAYAEGRNKTMGLSLFKRVFDTAWDCVLESEEGIELRYQNFCALIEAILAYHKAFGGKD